MAAGDALTAGERQRLDRAVRNAERASGLVFSVYLGTAEDPPRPYALRLHQGLADPAHSVLVVCDPEFRRLEVITGSEAMRRIDDTACGLAVATMKSFFLGGEIVEGLAAGVQQLGEAGRQAPTLHGRPA